MMTSNCTVCKKPFCYEGAAVELYCPNCKAHIIYAEAHPHTWHIPYGWRCPCCLLVHAPHIDRCECQMPPVQTVTLTDTTNDGTVNQPLQSKTNDGDFSK